MRASGVQASGTGLLTVTPYPVPDAEGEQAMVSPPAEAPQSWFVASVAVSLSPIFIFWANPLSSQLWLTAFTTNLFGFQANHV
jgi:hypothetical protein